MTCACYIRAWMIHEVHANGNYVALLYIIVSMEAKKRERATANHYKLLQDIEHEIQGSVSIDARRRWLSNSLQALCEVSVLLAQMLLLCLNVSIQCFQFSILPVQQSTCDQKQNPTQTDPTLQFLTRLQPTLLPSSS